jgi:uncharacterized protein YlxW (UPF0749 family)
MSIVETAMDQDVRGAINVLEARIEELREQLSKLDKRVKDLEYKAKGEPVRTVNTALTRSARTGWLNLRHGAGFGSSTPVSWLR